MAQPRAALPGSPFLCHHRSVVLPPLNGRKYLPCTLCGFVFPAMLSTSTVSRFLAGAAGCDGASESHHEGKACRCRRYRGEEAPPTPHGGGLSVLAWRSCPHPPRGYLSGDADFLLRGGSLRGLSSAGTSDPPVLRTISLPYYLEPSSVETTRVTPLPNQLLCAYLQYIVQSTAGYMICGVTLACLGVSNHI